jgi:hypothetical protein
MLNHLSPAAEQRWHASIVAMIGTKATLLTIAGKNSADQPIADVFGLVQLADKTRRVVPLRPLPQHTYHVGETVVLRLNKNFDTHDQRNVYQLMAYPN